MCEASADAADADSTIPTLTNTHTCMHAFHCTFLVVRITLRGCVLQNNVWTAENMIMIFLQERSVTHKQMYTDTHTPRTSIIMFEIQTSNHGYSPETGKSEKSFQSVLTILLELRLPGSELLRNHLNSSYRPNSAPCVCAMCLCQYLNLFSSTCLFVCLLRPWYVGGSQM